MGAQLSARRVTQARGATGRAKQDVKRRRIASPITVERRGQWIQLPELVLLTMVGHCRQSTGLSGSKKAVDPEQADVMVRFATYCEVSHDLADDAAEFITVATEAGRHADLWRLRKPIDDEMLVG